MALTTAQQQALTRATARMRDWVNKRVDEQSLDVARLTRASRDTLVARLHHIFDTFLGNEPTLQLARARGAGPALDATIDGTVNALMNDIAERSMDNLVVLMDMSPSAVNKYLSPYIGKDVAALPVSSRWVLQELTTTLTGGGSYTDRLLHMGEDLKGNVRSAIRQSLLSGSPFETVRGKIHKLYGIDNLADPHFVAEKGESLYKAEARRQWNLLLGEHAKKLDVLEVWFTTLDDVTTPGCAARHGIPLEELSDRPPKHMYCRCSPMLVPRDTDLEPYREEAREWLADHGYTMDRALAMEAATFDPAEHPRSPAGTEHGGEFVSQGGSTHDSTVVLHGADRAPGGDWETAKALPAPMRVSKNADVQRVVGDVKAALLALPKAHHDMVKAAGVLSAINVGTKGSDEFDILKRTININVSSNSDLYGKMPDDLATRVRVTAVHEFGHAVQEALGRKAPIIPAVVDYAKRDMNEAFAEAYVLYAFPRGRSWLEREHPEVAEKMRAIFSPAGKSDGGQFVKTGSGTPIGPKLRAKLKDTKAVDEHGDPVRVYHGTTFSFEQFRDPLKGSKDLIWGPGIYFSTSAATANIWANPDDDASGSAPGGNVRAAYLNVKKPFDLDVPENMAFWDKNARGKENPMASASAAIRARGFDAITHSIKHEDEPPQRTWIIFKPSQAHSAFEESLPGWGPHTLVRLAEAARASVKESHQGEDYFSQHRYTSLPWRELPWALALGVSAARSSPSLLECWRRSGPDDVSLRFAPVPAQRVAPQKIEVLTAEGWTPLIVKGWGAMIEVAPGLIVPDSPKVGAPWLESYARPSQAFLNRFPLMRQFVLPGGDEAWRGAVVDRAEAMRLAMGVKPLSEAEWKAEDHPKFPAGAPQGKGGEFAPKGAGGGAGGGSEEPKKVPGLSPFDDPAWDWDHFEKHFEDQVKLAGEGATVKTKAGKTATVISPFAGATLVVKKWEDGELETVKPSDLAALKHAEKGQPPVAPPKTGKLALYQPTDKQWLALGGEHEPEWHAEGGPAATAAMNAQPGDIVKLGWDKAVVLTPMDKEGYIGVTFGPHEEPFPAKVETVTKFAKGGVADLTVKSTAPEPTLKGTVGAPVDAGEPDWDIQGLGAETFKVAKNVIKGDTIKTKVGTIGTVLKQFNPATHSIFVKFPDFSQDVDPESVVAVAKTAGEFPASDLPDPETHSAAEEPEWDTTLKANVAKLAKNLKPGDTIKFTSSTGNVDDSIPYTVTAPYTGAEAVIEIPGKTKSYMVPVDQIDKIAFSKAVPDLGEAPEGFTVGTVKAKYASQPEGKQFQERPALLAGGLAVHVNVNGDGQLQFFEPGAPEWQVTHAQSGLVLRGDGFSSKENAVKFVREMLAHGFDWSLDGDKVILQPAAKDTGKSLVATVKDTYDAIQPGAVKLEDEPEPEEEEPEEEDEDQDEDEDHDEDEEENHDDEDDSDVDAFDAPEERDYPKKRDELEAEAQRGIEAVAKLLPEVAGPQFEEWKDVPPEIQQRTKSGWIRDSWSDNNGTTKEQWAAAWDKFSDDDKLAIATRDEYLGTKQPLPEEFRVIADGEDYEKTQRIAGELSLKRAAQVANARGLTALPTSWESMTPEDQEKLHRDWVNMQVKTLGENPKTGNDPENVRILAEQAWARLDDYQKWNKRYDVPFDPKGVPLNNDHMKHIADHLWSGWKSDSNQGAGRMLQQAVKDELGAHSRYWGDEEERNRRAGMLPGGYEGVKAYVRGLWETSQFLMSKAGVTHLELLRAVMLKHDQVSDTRHIKTSDDVETYKGHPTRSTFVKLPDLPLTKNAAASFTAKPSVANDWTGVEEHHKRMQRVVIKADVPATAVLTTPVYGQNVHNEKEVVVIGTPWNRWDAYLDEAPGREIMHLSEAETPKSGADKFMWQKGAKKTATPKAVLDLDGPHWLNRRHGADQGELFPKKTRTREVRAVFLEDWRPADHPRHPAGAPDSQGGEFAAAGGGGTAGIKAALAAHGWRALKGGRAYQRGDDNGVILVQPDGQWRHATMPQGDPDIEWDKHDVFGLFEDRPTLASGQGLASLQRHLSPPKIVRSIDDAVKLLGQGKGVMFERPEQVVTLLHKLAEIGREAKARGEKAPLYDLCKVAVRGTNLFCQDHVDIPRDEMPQLRGIPTPGSFADRQPRDMPGGDKVNLAPAFVAYLKRQGIKVERVTVPSTRLRATQRELNGVNVAGMMARMEKGEFPPGTMLTSREDYVLDGHHRWAATVGLEFAQGHDVPMHVERVDLPILTLVKMAKAWSRAHGLGGQAAESAREAEWVPEEHPRQPGGAPDGQGGEFMRAGDTVAPSFGFEPSWADVPPPFGKGGLGPDPKTGRAIMQPIGDPAELMRRATISLPLLKSNLERIVRQVPGSAMIPPEEGITNPRVKGQKRLDEKIAAGKPASTISDFLGARVSFGDDSGDALIRRLNEHGMRVIHDEDFLKNPKHGYRARHVQVLLPTGISAEVELIPREISEVIHESHKALEKLRRPGATVQEQKEGAAESSAILDAAWARWLARTGSRGVL